MYLVPHISKENAALNCQPSYPLSLFLLHPLLNVGKDGQYVQVYEKEADGKGWERAILPEISVALSRGSEAIAKEITRRLLPEYFRILALGIAQAEKDSAYANAKAVNFRVLAQAIGEKEPQERDENVHFSAGEAYGTIQASATTAELHLRSLTIDQAQHILKFLKGAP